jgi:hypothetical protein
VKLIIAGGRDFNDYNLLKEKLDHLLSKLPNDDIEIVSGCARGTDSLGERYAKEKGIPVKQFPAKWGQYGKRAGYLRNEEMALYATHCICFWDGESKGTKHMIDISKKQNLNLRIVRY